MSIVAAALGGAAVGSNLLGSYLNYKSQQDNLEYQKGLQRDIFAREDNSIARRVADLKASGLSPVLAAGQGAGTGAIISTQAPQFEMGDHALTAMNLLKMEQDISATRAQEEYTKMQMKNAGELLPAQLSSIEAQIKNADAQTYKTYQDAKKAKVEADNMQKTNTSGNNFFSQAYRDLFGTASKAVETIKKEQNDKAKGKPVKPETEVDKALKKMNQQPLYDY